MVSTELESKGKVIKIHLDSWNKLKEDLSSNTDLISLAFVSSWVLHELIKLSLIL